MKKYWNDIIYIVFALKTYFEKVFERQKRDLSVN